LHKQASPLQKAKIDAAIIEKIEISSNPEELLAALAEPVQEKNL
jgi:hypothetical protein